MKKIFLILVPVAAIAALAFVFLGRGEGPATNLPGSGLPFGSGEGVGIPALGTNSVGTSTPFDEVVVTDQAIMRLSNAPVAGFAIVSAAGETLVRYVDRASGHLFQLALPSASSTGSLEKTRLTNNTLPKIYEAYFRADGAAVLLRSLEENSDIIKNTVLSLTPSKATSTGSLYEVAATSLRGDIDSVAVRASTLFYSLKNSSSIVSSGFAGENSRTLFTSSFNNWRLGFLGTNLLIHPKASAFSPGYLYSLSSAGGQPATLIGPLSGLTGAGNSAGNRLLYSHNDNGTIRLFVKNLESSALTEILPASLSEKCVWSARNTTRFFCGAPMTPARGNEPDNWYLGKTHFTDYLWQFDADNQSAKLIAQPKTDFGLDLDIAELKLSPAEDYAVFINKRDQTLWAARLVR